MADETRMTERDVLAVTDALLDSGLDVWIAGGWAVDAVVGETTRPHRDLDLAVRSGHLDAAIDELGRLGFVSTLDLRPVRLVMEALGGRSVDLHPVTFDATGFGRQVGSEGRVYEYPENGFGFGTIGGRTVPCLTAEQLVRFHLGYEPLDHDRQDMALLRDRLGVEVPPPYQGQPGATGVSRTAWRTGSRPTK
jgi:lincosamide nucleotidyltransferase A/C/D/E